MTTTPSTISIPEIGLDDNARLIPLGREKSAIVDASDYEWLSQWKWSYFKGRSDRGYGVRRVGLGDNRQRAIYMHRSILNAPEGLQVDHINGNTLDNRRANLRIVTSAQNRYNQRPRADGASQFKGVIRYRDKWRATIKKGEQAIHLGVFTDEAQAARAYDKAARSLFGEYAYLNFPEEG